MIAADEFRVTRVPREPAVDWPPEWHAQAACLDADMNAFFPSGHALGSERKSMIAYAKWFCQRCPVRLTCLEENMTVPFGIFGGMTASERFRKMGLNPSVRFDRIKAAFYTSGDVYIKSGRPLYRKEKTRRKSSEKSSCSPQAS